MLSTSIKSNNYSNEEAILGVTKYILGEHNLCGLYGATGLPLNSLDSMVHSMHELKKEYRKTDGRQLLHLIISFDKEDSQLLTPQMALELGYLFTAQLTGYQTVFSIHDNTDFLHIHLVINSVNYCTGAKNGLSYQEIFDRYNPLFNQILTDYKKERLGIIPPLCTSIEELMC